MGTSVKTKAVFVLTSMKFTRVHIVLIKLDPSAHSKQQKMQKQILFCEYLTSQVTAGLLSKKHNASETATAPGVRLSRVTLTSAELFSSTSSSLMLIFVDCYTLGTLTTGTVCHNNLVLICWSSSSSVALTTETDNESLLPITWLRLHSRVETMHLKCLKRCCIAITERPKCVGQKFNAGCEGSDASRMVSSFDPTIQCNYILISLCCTRALRAHLFTSKRTRWLFQLQSFALAGSRTFVS